MYLTPTAVCAAYEKLKQIDDDEEGKRRRERTSALRYLFATAQLNHSSPKSNSLAPTEAKNRKLFSNAVGEVVRLDNDGSYSNDLHRDFRVSEQERATDYKAGNNFLTKKLKEGISDGYPRRPSPLITEQAPFRPVLHPEYAENIAKYGDWHGYKGALCVWLCRFDDLSVTPTVTVAELAEELFKLLEARYGSDFISSLVKQADIEKFFTELSGSLVDNGPPDILAALDSLISSVSATPSSSASPIGVNTIVYGAPGTGKSHYLNQFVPNIRTVFYPDYMHSTFVGGYRPYVSGGSITYNYIPGPFIQAFIDAIKAPDNDPVYLLIEELNRANAAAVFGEIFQLLDRDDTGKSAYSIEPDLVLKEFLDAELNGQAEWKGKLFIPSNLHLFASMNSADQGVEPLDSAFKRRWRYHFLPIDFDQIPAGDKRRAPVVKYNGREFSWVDFAQKLNNFLMGLGVDEDRLLGQYFMSESDLDDPTGRYASLGNKLFVYLWDDVLRHGLRHEVFAQKYRAYSHLIDDFLQGEWVFSDQFSRALTS